VVVENADGAGRRVVTSGARVRLFVPDGRKVAWSPDGTRIAFITAGLTGNDAAIEVADATTGAITKLTTSDGYNDLWWTPDSTALIAVDMTTFQVVRVAADGSGRRPLTQGDTDLVRAALSPDGSGVAFLPGQGTLTVVDVDGSGRRDLAAGVQSFASPWWSADSRWLLYVNVGSGLTGPVIAVNVGTGASVVIRSGDFGDAAW
jgi:Tol biopolymer transport system component